jgi:hypothetical protein
MVYAPFTVYIVLQIVAVVRLRGVSRAVSLVPVLPMAFVMAVTIEEYRHHSNLWPIGMIFGSVVAALFLAALILVSRPRHLRILLPVLVVWACLTFWLLRSFLAIAIGILAFYVLLRTRTGARSA